MRAGLAEISETLSVASIFSLIIHFMSAFSFISLLPVARCGVPRSLFKTNFLAYQVRSQA